MRFYDEKRMPECPICGAECNLFYLSDYHEVVGCDRCITETDAYEYLREKEIDDEIDEAYARSMG